MKFKLDILIPTYNRQKDLLTNMSLLTDYVKKLDLEDRVRFIISDNCSSDSTLLSVNELMKENPCLSFVLLQESSNKGLLYNIVKVLNVSSAEYIMYMGDDDFISFSYFQRVVGIISSSTISFILPSRGHLDPSIDLHTQLLSLTFRSLTYVNVNLLSRLYLSCCCNQLSGLVFKNNGLFSKWSETGSFNLYPFMSFAGWCLTPGTRAVRVSGDEVLITSSNSKDWGYGSCGLLPDIIDNVKFITANRVQRIVGELFFAFFWRDRIAMYLINLNRKSVVFLKEIAKEERMLLLTKIGICFLYGFLLIKLRFYRLIGRLKSPHDLR